MSVVKTFFRHSLSTCRAALDHHIAFDHLIRPFSISASLKASDHNDNRLAHDLGSTSESGSYDSRQEIASNKNGSEFGSARVINPHPSTLEPTAVKGAGDRFKTGFSEKVHAISDDLVQVALPDYGEVSQPFVGLDTDFPCLADNSKSGPEPQYEFIDSGYKTFHSKKPFALRNNKGMLPELMVAYETWGELNECKSNAVLILCGLSASSHVRSHKENTKPGWWEKFVGPGCSIDTDKYFVICANNLGGCYGTSGPSTINPLTDKPYGTTFPVFGLEDIVTSQFMLLDHLGIDKLYAAIGSSLGGMLSMNTAVLFPDRVSKVISISACIRSHPSSIAMRYLQRKSIMMDPNWQKGYYYSTGKYPKTGMKLAREIATLTYRSGPEWEERFGRKRIVQGAEPTLCPTFSIESYLDHQGESASTKLDPNTLLYISKAMDLYDLGELYGSVHNALSRVQCPVMVIGVQTDILFPVWQQREMANVLQESGNDAVTYFELNSIYGHDTFLLDLSGVGSGIKGFLDTQMKECGRVRKQKDADST